jgi:hypothetical protein
MSKLDLRKKCLITEVCSLLQPIYSIGIINEKEVGITNKKGAKKGKIFGKRKEFCC